MKFAQLAIIGVVAAAAGPLETKINQIYDKKEAMIPAQVEIPTISWNKGAVEKAGLEAKAWNVRH